jgi:hypothetical protein
MKTKIVLLALFVALATMGFECINSPITVALNIDPFSKCFDINPGPNTTYSGTAIIDPKGLIDDNYEDKIKDVRIYNITVRATGTFTGNVANGVVTINGTPILTYSGTWANFSTEQSILGGSAFIHPQVAGIRELIRILKLRPLQSVTLASTGTLTGGGVPPVPAGLGVCVNIYAQIDGSVE